MLLGCGVVRCPDSVVPDGMPLRGSRLSSGLATDCAFYGPKQSREFPLRLVSRACLRLWCNYPRRSDDSKRPCVTSSHRSVPLRGVRKYFNARDCTIQTTGTRLLETRVRGCCRRNYERLVVVADDPFLLQRLKQLGRGSECVRRGATRRRQDHQQQHRLPRTMKRLTLRPFHDGSIISGTRVWVQGPKSLSVGPEKLLRASIWARASIRPTRSLRRRPELNRGTGICSPLPNHSATPPVLYELHCNKKAGPGSGAGALERTTGFEPATPTLARSCSTTEPRPRCLRARFYSARAKPFKKPRAPHIPWSAPC
jgi:hypothetical protein